MEYIIALGFMVFPVNPKNLEIKTKSRNNTINLADGYEYNLVNRGSLREVSFEVLLPSFKYPFATYIDGFLEPKVYIDYVISLKDSCEPVTLRIRRRHKGKEYNQDILVVVESYKVSEDVNNGFDFMLTLDLKEYRTLESSKLEESATPQSGGATATKDVSVKEYTVVKNDNLWNIAKKHYGDGKKYTIIYEANKDKISNPNFITVGQVLKIPEVK